MTDAGLAGKIDIPAEREGVQVMGLKLDTSSAQAEEELSE